MREGWPFPPSRPGHCPYFKPESILFAGSGSCCAVDMKKQVTLQISDQVMSFIAYQEPGGSGFCYANEWLVPLQRGGDRGRRHFLFWVQAGTSGIFLFLERNLNEGDLDFCRLTVVPDLFGTRDPLHGRQFFHEPAWWGGGGRWLGWFKPITLNVHSTSVFITSAPPQIIRHWILDDLVSNISMHHL